MVNDSSCQRVKMQRILDGLFSASEDGAIYWMWKDGISVQHALKNDHEALKLFLDLYYDINSSHTTKTEEEME